MFGPTGRSEEDRGLPTRCKESPASEEDIALGLSHRRGRDDIKAPPNFG